MMKWFIGCLIVITIGLTFLIGMWLGVVIHVVDAKMEEDNRINLLILYDIRE